MEVRICVANAHIEEFVLAVAEHNASLLTYPQFFSQVWKIVDGILPNFEDVRPWTYITLYPVVEFSGADYVCFDFIV